MRLRPNRYHVRHDSAQCAAETLDAYPRWAECGADGTYARRSTVASRSSPAAAQRCAEGAGLDGGDRGRSTITCAVHRIQMQLNSTGAEVPMNAFDTSPIYTSLTDATPNRGSAQLAAWRCNASPPARMAMADVIV